jgi:hypothetical protein
MENFVSLENNFFSVFATQSLGITGLKGQVNLYAIIYFLLREKAKNILRD